MAIRIRNLDLQTPGNQRHETAALGDLSAVARTPCFVAPVACVIDSIDLVTTGRMPPAQATASVTAIQIRYNMAADSDTFLAVRTSTSASNATNAISANARVRVIPSGNNSLTQGSVIALDISAQGSASLSKTLVIVNYTPLVHRETR